MTATVGKSEIERLIQEHRLTACFQCGKCTASCPLSELFGDLTFGHTPRGIIERALVDADLVTGDTIWYCLTCDVCTVGCPCGVRLRDFIEALRKLVIEAGHDEHGVRCRQCGGYFLPDTTWKLVLDKLGGPINLGEGDEPPSFLVLCPRCRARDFAHKMKRELVGPAPKRDSRESV